MDSFEQILDYAGGNGELAYNRRVFASLQNAVERGNVIPFVGAGMSRRG